VSLAQDVVIACLDVSDLEVSMDEKAWLLVRFMRIRGRNEMVLIERDVRMKDSRICSFIDLRACTRASGRFGWGVTPLMHISLIGVTQICRPTYWLVGGPENVRK
jgi:hypothetical protein